MARLLSGRDAERTSTRANATSVPLILVPTPLGNLRDITLRALDVLRDCELVVAEDTRVAHRLFAALDIAKKPVWSYREQNAEGATPNILERASAGIVALVTDAGTPAISDPGRELVVAARAAGIAIEALPGPCAFVCGAVLSGFDLQRFSFEGFVPRSKAERERRLRAAYEGGATSLWYESPNRVRATLETLAGIDAQMAIFAGRELTKFYEQQVLGTPADVLAALADPPRGEFVLALAGRETANTASPSPENVDAEIDRALARGDSIPGIARALANLGFGTRAELYARASSRRPPRP
jgi:16S rRNA (cytidine1402-2'-O)-methyltransferase